MRCRSGPGRAAARVIAARRSGNVRAVPYAPRTSCGRPPCASGATGGRYTRYGSVPVRASASSRPSVAASLPPTSPGTSVRSAIPITPRSYGGGGSAPAHRRRRERERRGGGGGDDDEPAAGPERGPPERVPRHQLADEPGGAAVHEDARDLAPDRPAQALVRHPDERRPDHRDRGRDGERERGQRPPPVRRREPEREERQRRDEEARPRRDAAVRKEVAAVQQDEERRHRQAQERLRELR